MHYTSFQLTVVVYAQVNILQLYKTAHFLKPVMKFTVSVRCRRRATVSQGFANTTKDSILMSGV